MRTPQYQDTVDKIMNLNLDPMKIKLMIEDDGPCWTREQCNAAEKWYKRFLILNLLYPDKSIVPSKEIDEMWHYHILDTEKYAEDCQDTFGYFLHHFPYFGMRGEEDAKKLQSSFLETQELYIKEFGEPLAELRRVFIGESAAECDGSKGTTCSADDCSKCGASCSGAKCNPDSKMRRVDYSIRPSLAGV